MNRIYLIIILGLFSCDIINSIDNKSGLRRTSPSFQFAKQNGTLVSILNYKFIGEKDSLNFVENLWLEREWTYSDKGEVVILEDTILCLRVKESFSIDYLFDNLIFLNENHLFWGLEENKLIFQLINYDSLDLKFRFKSFDIIISPQLSVH